MDEQKNKQESINTDPSTNGDLQGGSVPEGDTPAEDASMSTTPEVTPATSVTPESLESATSENKSNALPLIIGIAIVVLLVVGAYFLLGQNGSSLSLDSDTNTSGQEANASSIADDSVVATVNGVDLLGKDLSYQMVQLTQAAGIQDMSQLDQQTLSTVQSQATDALVNSEILRQTAVNQGLAVSQEEVEAEFSSIVESVGGEEVANERLAALGITSEEFRAELERDLLIQKYIDANVEANILTVSEEEVQAFYEQVSNQQQGEVPPLEDVRDQIEQQLQFQKEQEAVSGLLQELRAAADVEIF